MDINKHKFYLLQILKDIYADIELANYLGFKGGTALMFFYDLPRFSVDLDFNLLDATKEKIVFEKIQNILLKYGSIFDEAIKYYGSIVVLNYGVDERKLKIEISNRAIVETRMKMPLSDYIRQCIDKLESMSDKGLLNGLGELLDNEIKNFVRTKLKTETIALLKFYKEFPILQ